jgi:hypothetical protein
MGPGHGELAGLALEEICPSVQFDCVCRSSMVVQAVDVLGDDLAHMALGLEFFKQVVGPVRLGLFESFFLYNVRQLI